MDALHVLTKRKIKRRFPKPLHNSSVSNVSKLILADLVKGINDNCNNRSFTFIPFNNERDGIGRIIKSKSPDRSNVSYSHEKLEKTVKQVPKTKKMLLRRPLLLENPSVGTYNLESSWIKPSFSCQNLKFKAFPKFQHLETKNRNIFKKSIENPLHPSIKVDVPLKNKFRIASRKKGIWEDITLHTPAIDGRKNPIEEAKKIVKDYDSSIKSSISKMKIQLSSIQKYLK
jgi:hypothetical protein